ncbi:PD-(D/E)XK nuclease-like domain-containing protein, partial [Candidatus Bathyarchaeota archaeon]|nr:PD-(D/E)XK nuclease-like domain-containing protein [Candidatus Bathyarchaeota archaeon]
MKGVYTDLKMDDYHNTTALSRSDIVRLNLSPQLYIHHKNVDKPEYRVGRALHGLVLQNVSLVVNPDTLRTKAGKAFQAENPDAVTPDMAVMIEKLAKRCSPYFKNGQAEVSFFWEDNNIICKCRPDWISEGIIYDFKTTRRSLEEFYWDVKNYFYYVQHAWYLRGVEQY